MFDLVFQDYMDKIPVGDDRLDGVSPGDFITNRVELVGGMPFHFGRVCAAVAKCNDYRGDPQVDPGAQAHRWYMLEASLYAMLLADDPLGASVVYVALGSDAQSKPLDKSFLNFCLWVSHPPTLTRVIFLRSIYELLRSVRAGHELSANEQVDHYGCFARFHGQPAAPRSNALLDTWCQRWYPLTPAEGFSARGAGLVLHALLLESLPGPDNWRDPGPRGE